MKKLKIFIALAIVVLAVSCAKKDALIERPQEPKNVYIRIQSVDVDGKAENYSRTIVVKN